MELALQEILTIILFIVPGYLIVYFISIITDYQHEKEILEKIVQYLVFSSLSYFSAIFLVSIISLFYKKIIEIILGNPSILTAIAIFLAPLLGFLLGHFYFGKGYPHNHFRKLTNKTNFPSIYSKIFKEFEKGCWVTCHIKTGEKIQGTICDVDLDEENKQYKISLQNAVRFINGKENTLIADKVIIDLNNCNFIQIKK